MEHPPLVSVVMPVHNIEKYLGGTLASLSAQTYGNVELLLIDDGSTDASGSLCSRYAETRTGVKYLRQPNRGVSAARNHGIREASGDYLMFLDSDDLFEPGMIEDSVRAMISHDADLVISGMLFDSLKNGAVKRRTIRSHKDAILTQDNLKDMYMDLFRSNYLTSIWNKLYKRSVVADNRILFDETLSNYEDLLFNLHFLPFMHNAVILAKPYYHYCQRETPGLSRVHKKDIADKIVHLITALHLQHQRLGLLEALPELTAHAQAYYVIGLCNMCLSDNGIGEQARAVSRYASNPVFSDYGIFDREYGNRFTRLCRLLRLRKRWRLLVMACRMRNFIRRIYY